MPYPSGSIPVTGILGTTGAADTYPVYTDELMLGGMRAVADNAARDAITAQRRAFGMLVFSVAANKCFKLANVAMGGASNTLTDNANWLEFGGAGVVSVSSSDVTISVTTTAGAVDVTLPYTGVFAGTYQMANVTVDDRGRITNATDGFATSIVNALIFG